MRSSDSNASASASWLRLLLMASADGLLLVGDAGCIHDASASAAHLFGYERHGLRGVPMHALLAGEDRPLLTAILAGTAPHHATRSGINVYEAHGLRADGSVFPLHLALDEAPWHETRHVAVFARGRSELRSAMESALRAAAAERRLLASDLHDDLGQIMHGATLLCHSLRSRLAAQAPELSHDLAEVAELIQSAARRTRALAYEIYPDPPDDQPLPAILGSLVRAMRAAFPRTEVRFSHDEVSQVPHAMSVAVYRIAQEALSNAIHHAHPERVDVALRASAEHLDLTVDDTPGSQFEAEPAPGDDGAEMPGIGLRLMRYRAERLGGSVDVTPRAGGGMRVHVRLPLNR